MTTRFAGTLFLLALVTFPLGTLVMLLSCGSGTIDGWDWVFSIFVPFYGLIEALVCR